MRKLNGIRNSILSFYISIFHEKILQDAVCLQAKGHLLTSFPPEGCLLPNRLTPHMLYKPQHPGAPSCTLIFSHPEIRHGLANDGIPQVNIDQFNPKTLFSGFSLPDILVTWQCSHVAYDGNVYNFTSLAVQLTQGKLLKTAEWSEWQQSEFTMLDQYEAQGIFGKPVKVDSNEAVFNLVWIYVVKKLVKHKNARCTCDGLSGQVYILDHTNLLCSIGSGKSPDIWCRCLQRFCRGPSPIAGLLHSAW